MYDYGLSVLPQYGITPESTSRTRGGLLCRTPQGILIVKEFRGSEKKLLFQQQLLLHLKEAGFSVDYFIENQEGALVTKDKDEIPYTLQRWYEGKECDTRSRDDILLSVRSLARLHKSMELPLISCCMEKTLEEEYVRHNQEIRKIRKFIRKKGSSNTFEKDFLQSVGWFLAKGEEALELLAASSSKELLKRETEKGHICHGEYNQHNVLIGGSGVAVTNFSHAGYDIQMADLYAFMRKILEKYNWDMNLARTMLSAYNREKHISCQEWEYLRIRFTYPEKYWKLANHYFSQNKAWISEKNVEKLKKLMKQKEIWENFAKNCFGTYPY